MEQPKMYFPTWLRATATILILLCHLVGYGGVPYGATMAQLFNIGVELFFLLSGFLFGVNSCRQSLDWGKWYIKRAKRIFLPYWFFLAILFIIHLAKGLVISPYKWIISFLGVQGFDAVAGAEQTWYITAQIFCYALTPVITYFAQRLKTTESGKRLVMLVSLLVIPLIMAFVSSEYIWVFFTPIIWYTLAFIAGSWWSEIEPRITVKLLAPAIIVMLFMFGIRILGRVFWDGTVLYNRVIVGYEHNIAAWCIAICFAIMLNRVKPVKAVQLINDISFEIYLYHFMFIGGPISVIGMTGSKALDFIIVVIVTFFASFLTNKAIQMIARK